VDLLSRVVETNAPYWGGEAEVFRTYWDWPGRSRATDRLWLLRQSYKEYWDGFTPARDQLEGLLGAGLADRGQRERAVVLARTAQEELAHFCAFAEVLEALSGPGNPALEPECLRRMGDWPENQALMRLRAEHKRVHGELGRRAHALTEGGAGTLYSEGAKLAGRGGVDDLIARACARVLDDEIGHMLHGIEGLAEEPELWERLSELSIEQMRLRIRMRNAQFGHPLPEARVRDLCAGRCEPLPFEWSRADRR
jgi:hypothetical protein